MLAVNWLFPDVKLVVAIILAVWYLSGSVLLLQLDFHISTLSSVSSDTESSTLVGVQRCSFTLLALGWTGCSVAGAVNVTVTFGVT